MQSPIITSVNTSDDNNDEPLLDEKPPAAWKIDYHDLPFYAFITIIFLIILFVVVGLPMLLIFGGKKEGFSPDNKPFLVDNSQVLNNTMDEVDYMIPAFKV